jgi:hypothetical protein
VVVKVRLIVEFYLASSALVKSPLASVLGFEMMSVYRVSYRVPSVGQRSGKLLRYLKSDMDLNMVLAQTS